MAATDDFLYVFAFIAVCTIIPLFLSVQWNRFYFQFGIPMFYRRYSVKRPIDFTTGVDKLERKFKGNYWHKALQFKAVDAGKCLFRQKPIEFRFKARSVFMVYGGMLRYNAEKEYLTVTGYLNWSFLALILGVGYLFYTQVRESLTIPLIVFGIMVGVMYLFEIRRYDEIGRTVVSLAEHHRHTRKGKRKTKR